MSKQIGQSSQVKSSSQGEEKTLRYDYTKIDEFLRLETEPRRLAQDFHLLHAGLADILAQVVYHHYIDGDFNFRIGEDATYGINALMRFFEVLAELKEAEWRLSPATELGFFIFVNIPNLDKPEPKRKKVVFL